MASSLQYSMLETQKGHQPRESPGVVAYEFTYLHLFESNGKQPTRNMFLFGVAAK